VCESQIEIESSRIESHIETIFQLNSNFLNFNPIFQQLSNIVLLIILILEKTLAMNEIVPLGVDKASGIGRCLIDEGKAERTEGIEINEIGWIRQGC
jgi:hypothetical protein